MKSAAFIATVFFALAASAQAAKPQATGECAIPTQRVAVIHCEPASIYVADFDRAAIEEVLNRHFDGFTILAARGCWHKTCESSVVIQIAGATEAQVRQAAEELRVAGKQEQVIVFLPARQVPRR